MVGGRPGEMRSQGQPFIYDFSAPLNLVVRSMTTESEEASISRKFAHLPEALQELVMEATERQPVAD
jgi:hypothetical protein